VMAVAIAVAMVGHPPNQDQIDYGTSQCATTSFCTAEDDLQHLGFM
jgi:hypothetical protein